MRKLSILLAAAVVAGSASAALMTGGYTTGASSQLLVGNGGSGTNLFVDTAGTGGGDVSFASGTAAWLTVMIDGAGQWGIGDTVEITGVALQIQGYTDAGTMTFDIRQAAGGTGTSGAGGLSSIASATASYAKSGVNDTMYVNFDTPVSFVADANSTKIGINIANSARLRVKTQANFPVAMYNYSNGNLGANKMKFSVAGNVIPEPASIGLIASVGGAILFIRRRLQI